MKKLNNGWLFLAAGISYILIFRNFFLSGPLVWGDAPFFYPANLVELFNVPLTWDIRTGNFGTSQAAILWLYIPTFLFGFFHQLFGWQSPWLIRLVYYFPGTILALVGAYILVGRFVKSSSARMIGALIYGLNSYLLVVIDGGQVGLVLAYGLFPWAVAWLSRFLESSSRRNFWLALVGLVLVSNADLRVLMLVVLTSWCLYLAVGEGNWWPKIKRSVVALLAMAVLVGLVDSFWLISFVEEMFAGGGQSFEALNHLNLINLTNSLFLFQPHFPNNQFGQVNITPFYYVGSLLLVLLSWLLKPTRRRSWLVAIFLGLVFVAKGASPSLGGYYDWLVDHLPLGVAFRDSSKFFIPLLLVAGILVAEGLEQVSQLLKFRWQKGLVVASAFLFINWLIYPALWQQLSGVLGRGHEGNQFDQSAAELSSEPGWFRTVWFPKKPPLGYSSWQKEALSANQFYKEPPFVYQIAGTYDLFNFLHSPLLGQWYRLLGIKYAYFPEDERQKSWTPRQRLEREQFLEMVDRLGYQRIPVSLPSYQVSQPLPKIFSQDKVILSVGGAGIYQQLSQAGFPVDNQGLIFLEDGLVDVNEVAKLPAESAILVNQGDDQDLAMTFLAKQSLAWPTGPEMNWGRYAGSDIIGWRYELLKNGLDSKAMDFGHEMVFSTVAGEKINMQLDVRGADKYVLAFRQAMATTSANLKVSLDGQVRQFNSLGSVDQFKWQLFGPVELSVGSHLLEFENQGGFQALNSPILVSQSQMVWASQQAGELSRKFGAISLRQSDWAAKLEQRLSKTNTSAISSQEVNPTEYRLALDRAGWVIFTDHYSPKWQLEGEGVLGAWPLDSMFNGFYLAKAPTAPLKLVYTPQRLVPIGIAMSVVAIIGIILVMI